MDLQRLNKYLFILIIVICSLILFYEPLFSNQPLGLDTLGHLSKVSYIRNFPFANWDMSWYSGTLFLKLYSPLFYYTLAIFPDNFLILNLSWFIAILLTCFGIYLLIKEYTKDRLVSLFCSLSFLSVLNISYYSISTGNLPYFVALFTLPFTLYFLEKTLQNKKYFLYYSIFFVLAILIHVVIGSIIIILVFLRLIFQGLTKTNLKRSVLYTLIPILLTSFWLLPFVFNSNSQERYTGYSPYPLQLLGFNDHIIWGKDAGSIGILAFLFLGSLFFFKKYYNRLIQYYLLSLIILGILIFRGLNRYYPLGLDPVRFILPFSVVLIIYLGLMIKELKLFNKKYLTIIFFIILLIGLIWNYNIINENFNKYSYYTESSRYNIFKDIMKDKNFPLENNFTNYRVGTSEYVFGEMLNYFFPRLPQTSGYQDVGMLNPKEYSDFINTVYNSNDLNSTYYYLNWFAIKYLIVPESNYSFKFQNNNFKEIMNYSKDYNFTMYEYLDAEPIISIGQYNNSYSIKEFSFIRTSPDKITITYNKSKDDIIIFKEFYHNSWSAKEFPSNKRLKIEKIGPGFMKVNPGSDSNKVIFYQSRTFVDYFGIILTIIGLIFLILIIKPNNK